MRRSSVLGLLLFVTSVSPALGQTPPNYRVAFIGDSNYGQDFQNVLDMMAREGVDAVVHAGDLAYSAGGVSGFRTRIEDTLGPNFPYFASVGNHDKDHWASYQAFLEPWATANGIVWDGDFGIQSSHEFQGIHFVLVAPGDFGGEHATYVRDRHALGTKGNDTGWGVYEESRRAGAIVATAHEHSYGRTFELSNVESAVVSHFDDGQLNPIALISDDLGTPTIDEGRSFVFVSGLGGQSVRNQDRCTEGWGPGAASPCDVWGAVYTDDQGATFGALIGEFNHGGDATLAHFYFMNVNDQIIDDFYVRSNHIPAAPPDAPSDLLATAASSNRIDLGWMDNSDNEGGFRIEQSTDGGGSFSVIAQVGGNVTSYSDAGLLPSTEYCYRVRAFNGAGPSDYTNTDCATTPAPTPPADPTDLVAMAVGSTQIDLSWMDQADDEDGFTIERSTDGGSTFTEIATVGLDVTSYSDLDLAPLTEYCYRVRAFNLAGNSGYSNTDCATTLDVPMDPPQFEEVVTGGASGTLVSTSEGVTAVDGDLYLAAISAKEHESVVSVTGLGLTWTLVEEQCSGRNQTGVSVWSAQGTPTGSGVVSATLAASAGNIVIAVSRYSRVDPFDPVSNVVSGNTNGVAGACSGGSDNSSYSLDITTALDNTLVYSAAARRNQTHTPGAGYTERAEVQHGSGGNAAGQAVQDRAFPTASTVAVEGSLSSSVDWAVVAVSIRPTSFAPSGLADSSPTEPTTFALRQSFPNPFGSSTTITYELPKADLVKLTVFNVHGERLAVLVDGHQPAGAYQTRWPAVSAAGSSLPSGVYFARLQVGGRAKTIKMMLIQ
jgi:hypothetical protein